MKGFLFFVILLACSLTNYAQLHGKLDNGREVLLKTDGTWKYADAGTSPDCIPAHTGTITVINKTSTAIYFYYATNIYIPKYLYFKKINAGDTTTIPDVPVNNGHGGKYDWKALLDKADNDVPLDKMTGIARGTLLVTQCADKKIIVE